ncbi:ComG operon protein 2 [Streptococcus thermophilus CNCM I-1630]|nr:ComG operon protein 2 [Streptococcus thermophilus CNCM I-1630]
MILPEKISQTIRRPTGIRSWKGWLNNDVSLRGISNGKKLKISQPVKVIQLFKQLLKDGFNLTEIVAFLERSHLLKEASLSLMKESLIRGDRLDQMLALVGFSDNIVTQISLADKHGNLLGSLTKIETYMLRMTKVRKKLMEVATYPILLLGLLILIMLGLKNYLLPHLLEGDGKNNWAVQLVQIFPQLLFVSFFELLLLVLFFYLWLIQHSPPVFYIRLSPIPLICHTLKLFTPPPIMLGNGEIY